MNVYVVTQLIHHAGRDEPRCEVIGVYDNEDAANKVAFIATHRWDRIAQDAAVEEMEVLSVSNGWEIDSELPYFLADVRSGVQEVDAQYKDELISTIEEMVTNDD